MQLTDLGIKHLLFLDFETYWAEDYTLSKMSTRDYVTDPRFQVIGMTTARSKNGSPLWVHDRGELDMVMQANDWEHTGVVSHNARFDMSVLQGHFNIRPGFIFDTRSMGNAEVKPFTGSAGLDSCNKFLAGLPTDGLDAAMSTLQKGKFTVSAKGKRYEDMSPEFLRLYGSYCMDDTSICRFIFLMMIKRFSLEELRLIDRTIRAYLDPRIVLNGPMLREYAIGLRLQKAKTLLESGADKTTLMSNDKFAQELKSLGVTPPMKISKTTGKLAYAFAKTDQGMTNLLEHFNPQVQVLAAARIGVKSTIEETRTARFIDIAEQHRTLAVPLSYCSAHTTRYGADENLNLQNLTKGSQIRHSMQAPRGHKMVVGDARQIEARVLAKLARQEDVVEAFRRGEDVYAFAASKIYGRPINEADDPKERFTGKVAQLSLGFAAGANSYFNMCRVQGVLLPMWQCEEIVKVWRASNPLIVMLWEDLLDSMTSIFLSNRATRTFRDVFMLGKCPVRKAGYIEFHNRLRIWYPEVRMGEDKYQKPAMVYAHRVGRNAVARAINKNVATNNAVQGLARTITMGHAVTLSDYPSMPLTLTVHDELLFIVQERLAERAAQAVLQVMRMPPLWMPGLPLDASVKVANTYGEAK